MPWDDERVILANPDILSESHVPPDIHGRESQRKEMGVCLRPITGGGKAVNCWENPTFFSVLECIARELRMLGAEKLSTSFKLERLKRHLSNERMVLVLDEIDQPVPKERNAILYNLSDLPTVGLICACNSQYVYFGLEERVKSRLNPSRILFKEYSVDELFQILEERARYALAPGTYAEEILHQIAELASGDARIAIQTLKNAA